MLKGQLNELILRGNEIILTVMALDYKKQPFNPQQLLIFEKSISLELKQVKKHLLELI